MMSRCLTAEPEIQLIEHPQHPIIPRAMAAEHESEVALAADYGSVPFRNHCLLCGTDLRQDWPDLSTLNPSDIKNHAREKWRRAAESGCSFCNIITAVIDDAEKQHGCSVPEDYRRIQKDSPFGGDLEGFQVFLGRSDSTGRYLLALEFVMMPLLVEAKEMSEWWGTITIYVDGAQPPCYPSHHASSALLLTGS